MATAREAVRRLGLVDAGLLLLSRLLAGLTRGAVRIEKYIFMAQPTHVVPRGGGSSDRAGGGAIHVERIDRNDPRLEQLPRPRAELERRFAAGSQCFAAWQRGRLAGFLWLADGGYDEDEVQCRFVLDARDRSAWDFDVHVEPRYRAGRTFALLWHGALHALRARGMRWSLSRVSAFNAESLRAHQRLGARRAGWAVFVLLGSLRVTLTHRGLLKCRWLKQGPYPALVVRAPREAAASGKAVDSRALAQRAPSRD